MLPQFAADRIAVLFDLLAAYLSFDWGRRGLFVCFPGKVSDKCVRQGRHFGGNTISLGKHGFFFYQKCMFNPINLLFYGKKTLFTCCVVF